MTDQLVPGNRGAVGEDWVQRGTRNVRTMEIFCILIVIMVSQVYTVVKIHWTVYLKWGDFTISQSYLNTLLIFLKRVKFHSIIFIGTEPIFFCKPKIHAQGSHLSGGEAYARSRPDHSAHLQGGGWLAAPQPSSKQFVIFQNMSPWQKYVRPILYHQKNHCSRVIYRHRIFRLTQSENHKYLRLRGYLKDGRVLSLFLRSRVLILDLSQQQKMRASFWFAKSGFSQALRMSPPFGCPATAPFQRWENLPLRRLRRGRAWVLTT